MQVAVDWFRLLKWANVDKMTLPQIMKIWPCVGGVGGLIGQWSIIAKFSQIFFSTNWMQG